MRSTSRVRGVSRSLRPLGLAAAVVIALSLSAPPAPAGEVDARIAVYRLSEVIAAVDKRFPVEDPYDGPIPSEIRDEIVAERARLENEDLDDAERAQIELSIRKKRLHLYHQKPKRTQTTKEYVTIASEAVRRYSERKGFLLAFDYDFIKDSKAGIVLAREPVDITNDVIATIESDDFEIPEGTALHAQKESEKRSAPKHQGK